MPALRSDPSPLSRPIRHSTVRFALVGAAGYALDVTILALLTWHGGLSRPVNVSIAFWVTYAVNFVLHRRLTFGAHTAAVGGQLVRYLPQVLADYALTLGAVEVLTALGLGLVEARLVAGGTNAVLNYCVYRWWTFRGAVHPDGADLSTR